MLNECQLRRMIKMDGRVLHLRRVRSSTDRTVGGQSKRTSKTKVDDRETPYSGVRLLGSLNDHVDQTSAVGWL